MISAFRGRVITATTTRHHHLARIASRLCMSSDSNEAIRTVGPGSHVSEIEIKKSRFLGHVKNVDSWEDAKAYIDQVKQEHPKARHWCFGFQCGTNPITERSSDDGEPTGTAGAPIIGAIAGEELSDIICVVVRYSGGIKLGAGGLIRAYGGAARLVMREAPILETQPKSTFHLTVDSTHVGSIYESVSKAGATPSGEEYGADGSFAVTVTCEMAVLEQLQTSLTDATKGTVEFDDNQQ